MLKASFDTWYGKRGWGRDYFSCAAADACIFFDVYNDMTPGCSIAAFDEATGCLQGACFYHPRKHHVSLGIMAVHPDFAGRGIGSQLVSHITRFTDNGGYRSLRVVSSGMNMDSFSLYNRAGLVPRACYHDMVLPVPAQGLGRCVPGVERVRDAIPKDIPAMADLEMTVSGIERKQDYAYAVDNRRGDLHAAVLEASGGGGIDGHIVSVRSAALNMIGPCVARTEADALALILSELDRFRRQAPLFLVPVDARRMVETLYSWGGRNVEIHLYQARGDFRPFAGISMPSFLPETG